MDGSNRNVFLSSKTVLWPNGLSLDIPQGILYWVDAYYDRIEMVYLNSSERKVSTRSHRQGCVTAVIKTGWFTEKRWGTYSDGALKPVLEIITGDFNAMKDCMWDPF